MKLEPGAAVGEHTDGHYESALVRVGKQEYRPLCWAEERTMKFEMADGIPQILFRYRHGSYQTDTDRNCGLGQDQL
ncbi:hypothetical protein ACFYSH_33865 [Streptomyces sp. NPDC005791]|uniref:hypothetical protein n=1 Tax=Streptomyces sp. NPDC005791 TaxID=3364732 RepID=UPI0036CFD4B8